MEYTKQELKLKIQELEDQLSKCQSNFEYWNIQNDLSYWKQRLYWEEN